MAFKEISLKELSVNAFTTINDEWLLICTRDCDNQRENMMTASWGGFGILWNRAVCYLFVRPQRHTHKLLKEQESFTVAVLPEECRDAHKVCGRLSGRDLDKLTKTGLHAADFDGLFAPEESKLVFTVRRLYEDTIKKDGFLEEALLKNYPTDDFHTVYVCEIEKAYIKE